MNRELHYRYTISYLLSALVLLIALAYFKVPDLVDKLSFALTLSSLLLAILAIFYTIVSAQKQDTQLAKLVETNAAISTAATEIRAVSRQLGEFAQEAPQHFQELGSKLDNLMSSYSTVASSTMGNQQSTIATDSELPAIDVLGFTKMFGKLHFAAMGVLYLFERCNDRNTGIERDTWKELRICTLHYAVGLLNGLEAAGLVSYKIHNGAVVPSWCAQVVTETIGQRIDSVINAVNPEAANQLATLKSTIDMFVA